jgi:hypothetical protein
MTDPRIKRHISFSDFIATEFQGLPFSREQLLEMAVDQLNDNEPLTVITKKFIFVISLESIAEFFKPTDKAATTAVAMEADAAEPSLPGEPEAKPVV